MKAAASVALDELLTASFRAAVREELAPLREQLASLTSRLPARLVTVAEAAAELGVHQQTVRQMVRDGRIGHRRVGRALRIEIDGTRGAGR